MEFINEPCPQYGPAAGLRGMASREFIDCGNNRPAGFVASEVVRALGVVLSGSHRAIATAAGGNLTGLRCLRLCFQGAEIRCNADGLCLKASYLEAFKPIT